MKTIWREPVQKAPGAEMSLMKLTIPILVETALVMMMGFVDVFVLGRYDDLAASGVNAANQVVIVVSTVILVFSSAGSILISQFLGAGERQAASRFAALSIVLHCLSGATVSLLLLLFNAPLLRFIGTKDEVFQYAQQYLQFVCGSILLSAVSTSMAVTLRSHGLTKPPMLVGVCVNALNIALDLLLIPGELGFPAMGVRGAAFATIVSRAVAVVAMAVILFRTVEKPSIFRLLGRRTSADLKLFLKTGGPAAAESFLYHVSQLVITSLVLHFLSESELIAKTYLYIIVYVFCLFPTAIGQAAQIIVGHRAGAGDYGGARRTGWQAVRVAILLNAALGLIGILARGLILPWFTDNREVIRIASALLVMDGFLELARAVNLTVIPCMRGAGDVTFPMLWAVFSNWVIGLGGAQLLGVTCGYGITGLWVAMIADEAFRAVLMLGRWRGKRWENRTAIGG